MIISWIDVGGAALLWWAGLHHLRQGQARALHRGGRWRADLGALLCSLLGGALFAMGLALALYSIAFAAVSEGLIRR